MTTFGDGRNGAKSIAPWIPSMGALTKFWIFILTIRIGGVLIHLAVLEKSTILTLKMFWIPIRYFCDFRKFSLTRCLLWKELFLIYLVWMNGITCILYFGIINRSCCIKTDLCWYFGGNRKGLTNISVIFENLGQFCPLTYKDGGVNLLFE